MTFKSIASMDTTFYGQTLATYITNATESQLEHSSAILIQCSYLKWENSRNMLNNFFLVQQYARYKICDLRTLPNSAILELMNKLFAKKIHR